MAIIALLVLPACDLDDACRAPAQRGPGLTGTAVYTTADGAQLAGTLRTFGVSAGGTIDVDGTVGDASGNERSFVVSVHDLAAGRAFLAARDEACLRRETDAEPVCAPLAGMVDVQALVVECKSWQCAATIDLALYARSESEGTVFYLEGEMHTVGSWVETTCDD